MSVYLAPLDEDRVALLVKALERYGMDERSVALNDRMSMEVRAAALVNADAARDLRFDLLNRTLA